MGDNNPLKAKRKPKSQSAASPFGMWGQRLGGKKGMPLDLGVALTGMLAHSVAPNEWGGRMGKDLASLGGTMYSQRLRHELGAPERELGRRLTEAQIKKAGKDPLEEFKAKRAITQPERDLTTRLTNLQIKKAGRPELIKGAEGAMVEKAPGAKFYTERPKLIKGAEGKMVPEAEGAEFFRKGLSPSAQSTQIILDAKKAYLEGTATSEQKKLLKVGSKYTMKDVVDILGEEDYEDLSEVKKASVRKMLEGDIGLRLEKEELPAEREGFWDWGKPNIPATTRERLVPTSKEQAGAKPQGLETQTTGEMAERPSAKQHKGKIIRDTETNKRYKSNGTQWIEIN